MYPIQNATTTKRSETVPSHASATVKDTSTLTTVDTTNTSQNCAADLAVGKRIRFNEHFDVLLLKSIATVRAHFAEREPS